MKPKHYRKHLPPLYHSNCTQNIKHFDKTANIIQIHQSKSIKQQISGAVSHLPAFPHHHCPRTGQVSATTTCCWHLTFPTCLQTPCLPFPFPLAATTSWDRCLYYCYLTTSLPPLPSSSHYNMPYMPSFPTHITPTTSLHTSTPPQVEKFCHQETRDRPFQTDRTG